MCCRQQEEIRKLKEQIAQLKQLLLHTHTETIDENRLDNLPDEVHVDQQWTRRTSDILGCSSEKMATQNVAGTKERIARERHLLEKAKELVRRQKKDLKIQMQKLREDKEAWQNEQTCDFNSVILADMERVLDNVHLRTCHEYILNS
jgi:hypothetical protein